MFFPCKLRRGAAAFVLAAFAIVPLAPVVWSRQSVPGNGEKAEVPWKGAEALQAADLVRELGDSKKGAPKVVYVGFRTLFEGGHVPTATFRGTASKEDGLADLKKWLATLPRSTNLVIYCGCCPLDRCPNIRPAYKALQDMGFSHVRVLVLPTSFAADWVEKGYPMEKGL